MPVKFNKMPTLSWQPANISDACQAINSVNKYAKDLEIENAKLRELVRLYHEPARYGYGTGLTRRELERIDELRRELGLDGE